MKNTEKTRKVYVKVDEKTRKPLLFDFYDERFNLLQNEIPSNRNFYGNCFEVFPLEKGKDFPKNDDDEDFLEKDFYIHDGEDYVEAEVLEKELEEFNAHFFDIMDIYSDCMCGKIDMKDVETYSKEFFIAMYSLRQEGLKCLWEKNYSDESFKTFYSRQVKIGDTWFVAENKYKFKDPQKEKMEMEEEISLMKMESRLQDMLNHIYDDDAVEWEDLFLPIKEKYEKTYSQKFTDKEIWDKINSFCDERFYEDMLEVHGEEAVTPMGIYLSDGVYATRNGLYHD